MKKKFFALLLSLCVMLSFIPTIPSYAVDYDTSLSQNHLRIKVNVYDWDAMKYEGRKVPVQNVNIGVTRVATINAATYNAGTIRNFITLSASDENGIAYVDCNIQDKGSNRPLIYLNGTVNPNTLIFDGWNAWPYWMYFKFECASTGYSIDYSSEYSVSWLGGNAGLLDPYTPSERVSGGHATSDTYGDYFSFHNESALYGSSGEFEVYVKADKVTVSYENRNVKDWDPDDYPTQRVNSGTVISAPEKTPVNILDEEIPFLGWADKATGALFDFSLPVTSDVTLVPKWGSNSNIVGYIHLDSYLWDHNAYNGTYRTGQTNITVNGLKYVVEYYDSAVAGTTQWRTLTTVDVDENGHGEIIITADMLQELREFRDQISVLGEEHYVAIDIGPDKIDTGWHEENQRPLNYAWDWITYDFEQDHGAGLVGVRMMWVNDDPNPFYDGVIDNNHWTLGKEGNSSTPTVGNVQYSSNVNHVPWVTDGMLNDGFEIWWKCYVAPSMTVNFDLDGGVGTGDYTEQMMKPVDSLNVHIDDFLVRNPGGTVTKEGMTFVGWYKVNDDDTLETIPWDFENRIVTESMVLRAVYAETAYSVKFVTDENGTQELNLRVGDTPSWSGPNPTKASDSLNSYVFVGWKETTGSSVNSEYVFNEEYGFDNQSRNIYVSGSSTPVTVDNTFSTTTIYTAVFEAIPFDYTVRWENYNGTLLEEDTDVPAGTTPTYDGATPVKPSDNGYTYTFSGWTPSVGPVSGDITYTATFDATPINYTITYDLNGGTLSGSTEQDYNITTNVTLLGEPSKYGWKFVGWKLDTSAGNWSAGTYQKSQNVGTGKYGDITLVAQWQVLYGYELIFQKNTTDTVTGMPVNVDTVWYETSSKDFTWTTEPVRSGYRFLGWAETATGSVVIPAGTKTCQITGIAGDVAQKELFAVWEEIIEKGYVVKYVDIDTNLEIISRESGTGVVGATVNANAASITGYNLESSESQSIVISENESENVIIFYYSEKTADIEYKLIICDGNDSETEDYDSEEIKVINGDPDGCTAPDKPGYKFVGWYSDPEGNVKISDDTHFEPSKNQSTGMYEDASYYAKYEAITEDLTISVTGCSDDDENQSFIIHVTSVTLSDPDLPPIDMYVTVQGNGSVTIKNLPEGTYKVEEEESWSWRYSSDGEQYVDVDENGADVLVENTRENAYWFNGCEYAINTEDGKKRK